MPTGYEVEMYHNIGGIRRSLDRIADALEKLVEIAAEESTHLAEEDPSNESH